nr:P3a [Luteovirus glycinis]WTM05089.1 P3a [Luteovirus glycinis]WTM05095.1 P3a [Luteovirus glycinis]WTM05101.1 P3a [Luteovirus glycinis]WTM05107.1 P3a [Luteovirus glycinis]
MATDYKFLSGFASGFISSIPVSILAIYFVYLKISKNLREIINEYGRG